MKDVLHRVEELVYIDTAFQIKEVWTAEFDRDLCCPHLDPISGARCTSQARRVCLSVSAHVESFLPCGSKISQEKVFEPQSGKSYSGFCVKHAKEQILTHAIYHDLEDHMGRGDVRYSGTAFLLRVLQSVSGYGGLNNGHSYWVWMKYASFLETDEIKNEHFDGFLDRFTIDLPLQERQIIGPNFEEINFIISARLFLELYLSVNLVDILKFVRD